MKILNEFRNNSSMSNEDIKQLIITDLAAKIGAIKGLYPNKNNSETNLDIIFRHTAFEDGLKDNPISSVLWDNTTEIYNELIKVFPVSNYFFGKEFPKIRWFITNENTIIYTLV